MKLNEQQLSMLEGGQGPGAQKAMNILVAYGDCYDAELLVGETFLSFSGERNLKPGGRTWKRAFYGPLF